MEGGCRASFRGGGGGGGGEVVRVAPRNILLMFVSGMWYVSKHFAFSLVLDLENSHEERGPTVFQLNIVCDHRL